MTNARLHLALVTVTATTATTLFALHPPALAPTTALAALGIATAWVVATGISAWLAVSSGAALVALVFAGRPPSAVVRVAPAFVRRLVEVALVGSCIVGSAVPASATSRGARRDIPVVRAPASVTTTTRPRTATRRPAPPSTTTPAPITATSAPRPTAPVTQPPTAQPAPTATAPATPRREEHSPTTTPAPRAAIPHGLRRYTVRPGDNLWSIARAALGANTVDADVAPYWRALIAANRSRLRSGDPNLIYPGEVLGLPDRGANQ